VSAELPCISLEATKPCGCKFSLKAKIFWLRARLDLAARISAQRNFRNANAVKCHPEPTAKDLAAALFAAAICLVFGGFAHPRPAGAASNWKNMHTGSSSLSVITR
jgi:hypothetical protein